MAFARSRNDPTSEEFESLQFCFGFMFDHGVQFPKEGAIFYLPPTGKVRIPVLIFRGWAPSSGLKFLRRSYKGLWFLRPRSYT